MVINADLFVMKQEMYTWWCKYEPFKHAKMYNGNKSYFFYL